MHRMAIHDDWSVRAGSGPVPAEVVAAGDLPATVPGVVHTDLQAAGLIPDPFLDQNETTVGWIGRTGWLYSTVLEPGLAMPGERRHLVFDGLDTVATVELDGVVLGQTENQHRSHRFDVTDLLGEGDHDLTVRFAAQLDEAERRSLEIGPLPHVNPHPYNAIRKMACNFGWDWGPDLVTAGHLAPGTARDLEHGKDFRGAAAGRRGRWPGHRHRPCTAGPGTRPLENQPLDRLGRVGSAVETVAGQPGEVDIAIQVTVDDVDLWWPRGYGSQHAVPGDGHPDRRWRWPDWTGGRAGSVSAPSISTPPPTTPAPRSS